VKTFAWENFTKNEKATNEIQSQDLNVLFLGAAPINSEWLGTPFIVQLNGEHPTDDQRS
jgi:hypothetical protein